MGDDPKNIFLSSLTISAFLMVNASILFMEKQVSEDIMLNYFRYFLYCLQLYSTSSGVF